MFFINHALSWQNDIVRLDGETLFSNLEADDIYRSFQINYIKYFKMDALSKAAFLASEILVSAADFRENKDEVALVLSSAYGCLDVDRKFEESRHSIASPALFVYTLPNIMLGEICIRHKFKGEQMMLVSEEPDYDLMSFYVTDLLENRAMSACLCGHADAIDNFTRVELFWVSKEAIGKPLNSENLASHFSQWN